MWPEVTSLTDEFIISAKYTCVFRNHFWAFLGYPSTLFYYSDNVGGIDKGRGKSLANERIIAHLHEPNRAPPFFFLEYARPEHRPLHERNLHQQVIETSSSVLRLTFWLTSGNFSGTSGVTNAETIPHTPTFSPRCGSRGDAPGTTLDTDHTDHRVCVGIHFCVTPVLGCLLAVTSRGSSNARARSNSAASFSSSYEFPWNGAPRLR
jgi:hypothetical protein